METRNHIKLEWPYVGVAAHHQSPFLWHLETLVNVVSTHRDKLGIPMHSPVIIIVCSCAMLIYSISHTHRDMNSHLHAHIAGCGWTSRRVCVVFCPLSILKKRTTLVPRRASEMTTNMDSSYHVPYRYGYRPIVSQPVRSRRLSLIHI